MKTPKTETSNRGIWTYSGRGPQKECPAYESAWKSGDGSLADESGEVDEGIAYKTYKL